MRCSDKGRRFASWAVPIALFVVGLTSAGAQDRGLPGPLPRWLGHDGPYRDITQSARGDLWLGGPDGAWSVDVIGGHRSAVTRFPVERLEAGPDGTLWAVPGGADENEPRLWIWRTGVVDPQTRRLPLEAAHPRDIAPLASGGALVLADNGLWRIDQRGDVTVVAQWSDSAPSQTARTVAVSRDGSAACYLKACAIEELMPDGPAFSRACELWCAPAANPGAATKIAEQVDDLTRWGAGGLAAAADERVVFYPADLHAGVEVPRAARGERLLIAGGEKLWLIASESLEAWSLEGAGWERSRSIPVAIGRITACAPDRTQDVVYALGVNGIARLARGKAPEIVHRVDPLSAVPKGWLAAIVVLPVVSLAVFVGLTLVLVRRWRGERAWSLTEAWIALTLFFSGQLVTSLIWFVSGGQIDSVGGLTAALSGGGLVSLVFIRWRLGIRGRSAQDIGWSLARPGADVLWGLAAVLPALLLVALVNTVCVRLGLPHFLYEQTTLAAALTPDTPLKLALIALLAVVVAPLFEETLFRGFVFVTLRQRFGSVVAVAATAILFGAVHVEGIATTGTLGLVLALLVLRRGRILPAVVTHAAVNGISLTVLMWAGAVQH